MVHVISIDPAPAKGAVIFDGKRFSKVAATKLPAFCSGFKMQSRHEGLLLCWDAPLTGPAVTDGRRNESESAFSQRCIEKFFSRSATGYKCPAGISVLPYSGCSHWAISRSALGYPIVGKFDTGRAELPFKLLDEEPDGVMPNLAVVETHPAIAIWLWCRSRFDATPKFNWRYKGKNAPLENMVLWDTLREVWNACDDATVSEIINSMNPPVDDDELDAVIGWVLGQLLLSQGGHVQIVGSFHTGAILLPRDTDLCNSFNLFRQREIP